MQREAPLTPKSSRTKRTALSTPDRTYSTSMESLAGPRAKTPTSRATMALDQTLSASVESLAVPRARPLGQRVTMAPGDFLAPDSVESSTESTESLAVPHARPLGQRVTMALCDFLAPDSVESSTESTESLAVPHARPLGQRVTMAPCDFLAPAPGLFGKKRLPSSRQSIMPNSHGPSFLDSTKRLEPDNKDLEMKLLYDKCLQTQMIELLMKKKAEDKKKVMVSQLGMLTKEDDTLHEKLCSMTAKEKDLRHFMKLQDDLDNHFAELTACLEKFDNNPVKILKQLKSVLESLDTLNCKNIVIPEKPEDMQKIHELFAKCSNNLQLINNLIGNRRNTLSTVNGELIAFTRAHDDVKDLAKKAEQMLCCLQVDVLKDAARSMTRNQL